MSTRMPAKFLNKPKGGGDQETFEFHIFAKISPPPVPAQLDVHDLSHFSHTHLIYPSLVLCTNTGIENFPCHSQDYLKMLQTQVQHKIDTLTTTMTPYRQQKDAQKNSL